MRAIIYWIDNTYNFLFKVTMELCLCQLWSCRLGPETSEFITGVKMQSDINAMKNCKDRYGATRALKVGNISIQ